MKQARRMAGMLALVGLLGMAVTSVSSAGLFEKDETVGTRFRKAIEKIKQNCESRKLARGEVCGEVAFEPADAPKPDIEAALEDRPLGGLGLFLIYQTMDNIDYQSSEEGNTLTFTKYIK